MDGWIYEKLNSIEQMLAYLVQELEDSKKGDKDTKDKKV